MRYGISGSEEDRAAAERAREAALRAAVERRAETDAFDDRFLLALEAFISTLAGQQRGPGLPISGPQAGELLATLRSVRARALECVRRGLPVEIRCIEYLMVIGEEAVRENTMAYAIGLDGVFDAGKPFFADCPRLVDDAGAPPPDGEGEGGRPAPSAMERGQRLLSGCNQMIEDMEKASVVVDVVMLARLVLLRENLRDHVHDEALMSMAEAGVSRQEMAFMKELISVGDAGRRRALLADAFGGRGVTLPGAKGKTKATTKGGAGAGRDGMDADSIREMFAASLASKAEEKGGRGGGADARAGGEAPAAGERKEEEEAVGVRPGRFFDATRLLEVELKIERVRFGPRVRARRPPPRSPAFRVEGRTDLVRGPLPWWCPQTPDEAARDAAEQQLAGRARQNAALMARIVEVIRDARSTLDAVVSATQSR